MKELKKKIQSSWKWRFVKILRGKYLKEENWSCPGDVWDPMRLFIRAVLDFFVESVFQPRGLKPEAALYRESKCDLNVRIQWGVLFYFFSELRRLYRILTLWAYTYNKDYFCKDYELKLTEFVKNSYCLEQIRLNLNIQVLENLLKNEF